MGLFGKAAKTKTEVKPSQEVESLLKDIVNRTQNSDIGEYIQHETAKLTPEGQQAINRLAQSGNLKAAAQALSPRLAQGLQQTSSAGQELQEAVNQKTDVNDILKTTGNLQRGLYAQAQAQGAKGTSAYLNKSGAARSDLAKNAQRIAANNRLNPGLTNLAIGQANTAQGDRIQGLGLQSNVAGSNVRLGQQGVTQDQTALANQLQAGNIQQQIAQTNQTNQWQNAMGQQLFPWQQLQNKANVMGQVSGMAGYTSTGTTPGVSTGQQLLGAGLTGLSIYGNLGGFASGQATSGKTASGEPIYTNQFSNAGNTGMFNKIGSWFS